MYSVRLPVCSAYLLLPLTLALAACNSNDNVTTTTTTSTDTTAPTVSSTSPLDGATGVARTGSVTATFDEDIFATTIDDNSFTLTSTGTVRSNVSFDGASNVATLTPTSTLAMLTTYTATLTTAITDLSGNALAANHAWSFTTADGTWGTAALIETDNSGSTSYPEVAVDASGNAVAVWQQSDGTRNNIWANRYDAGTDSWGSAALIETDNSGSASYPEVAVDASGNAVAVWQQSDGARDNIWVNRYDAGTDSWDTAALIETDNSGPAYEPQVAVDASGNAVAVWQQSDGTRFNIQANRYDAGTDSWGTAALIETDNSGSAGPAQVAVGASGNAVAVWRQYDGSVFNVWVNRYDAGTDSWGTAVLIETDNTGNAYDPQVAVDASGNAVAVWRQQDGGVINIQANRYDAGTDSWGTAVLIETDNTGSTYDPQVAVDASGNAVAVWTQSDGTRANIWANRYDAGTDSWGTAALIEADNSGNAIFPQVAVDASGNAVAVWQQFDGARFNIQANRYNAGSSNWDTAALIETDNSGSAEYPRVGVNASGNAVAVWNQYDGAQYNIQANRFE